MTELATKNKFAVVIVRPYPITILRLKNWLNRINPNEIVLAPLSAVTTVKDQIVTEPAVDERPFSPLCWHLLNQFRRKDICRCAQ